MADDIKSGARHSAGDQRMIQDIHDTALKLGAQSPTADLAKNLNDTLIAYGGAVKALDDGKVGGYLVRFGGAQDTDLEGEYFSADTDFGFAKGETLTTPLWLNHCQPLNSSNGKQIAIREPIGEGTLSIDDNGVLIDAILYERERYKDTLAEMGWSSGTAAHTTKRKPNGKATHITRWHLGLDASITPSPAEPRNQVISLKTLQPQAEPKGDVLTSPAEATVTASQETSPTVGGITQENEMDESQFKSIVTEAITPLNDNFNALNTRLDKVENALKNEKPNNNGGTNVTVTLAAEDRPFKNLAEQCAAVKTYESSKGRIVHPRMKGLAYMNEQNGDGDGFKAITGASESLPMDGGLLLEPTISSDLITNLHTVDSFSGLVRKLPVSANSNYGWINGVDETSRVAGSRWGGIRGYRLAEGATLTASQPKFRRIQWELKKYGVLVYGTDELLADSAMFSTVVDQGCREELAFMLNDDIMNGLGLAGPQGFMNSAALITVTRDTGSAIKGADISAMWNRLDPRGRKNAYWFIGNDSQPQLDNLFAVGSTAVLYPYASIGADGIQKLYNRPVIVSEFCATLNTTGDIALIDPTQYLLWEKTDVQAATSIHVQFLTDQTVFRFIYRADGQSSVASALTPYKGSTTTSPFVVLGSAT